MVKLKKVIKKLTKSILLFICSNATTVARKVCRFLYKWKMFAEWSIIDNPENFDHHIDLYYLWGEYCYPHWLERGIYSIQALKMFEAPIVVELCCGDGFNAKHFYSTSAKHIYACDYDLEIIRLASKQNKRDNITYKIADIRSGIKNIFPEAFAGNEVTNIIWDAAIEHFTPDEVEKIMSDIKTSLGERGILSGFGVVERKGGKQLNFHQFEFKNMEDLKRFLSPWFANVIVFETIYENRHNLYFYASNGEIPFDNNWEHWLH